MIAAQDMDPNLAKSIDTYVHACEHRKRLRYVMHKTSPNEYHSSSRDVVETKNAEGKFRQSIK